MQTLEGHSVAITSVTFSPDGKLLASASVDGHLKLWDISTGTVQQTFQGNSEQVQGRGDPIVAFSLDGEWLISTSNKIKFWHISSGTTSEIFSKTLGTPTALDIHPGGKQVAFATDFNVIKIWDTASSTLQQTLDGHADVVHGLAYSHDGLWLASASHDKRIMFWNTSTGEPIKVKHEQDGLAQRSLEPDLGHVYAVSISSDGKKIAAAFYECTVVVWNISGDLSMITLSHQKKLEGYQYLLRSVAFNKAGTRLAAADIGGVIKIWNASLGALQVTINGPDTSVLSLVFSPDGRYLASGGDSGDIRLWDIARAECMEVRTALSDPKPETPKRDISDATPFVFPTNGVQPSILDWIGSVDALKLSSDGKSLASYSSNEFMMWDIKSRSRRYALKGQTFRGNAKDFCFDSEHLVLISDDTVGLYEVETGIRWTDLGSRSFVGASTVLSPNGKQLATIPSRGHEPVELWNVYSGHREYDLAGCSSMVTSISFFPTSGKLLAIGFQNGFVQIWEATTGILNNTLKRHRGIIRALVFTPDGRQLASSSVDKTIKLWDITAYCLLCTFDLYSGSIVDAILSSLNQYSEASNPEENHARALGTVDGVVVCASENSSGNNRTLTFSSQTAPLSRPRYSMMDLWAAIEDAVEHATGPKSNNYTYAFQHQTDILAFSHDIKYLAASIGRSIKVYNVSTCAFIHTFQTGFEVTRMSFSGRTTVLETNNGHLAFPSSDQDSENNSRNTIMYGKDDWIMHGEKRLLWIPSDCRPWALEYCNGIFYFGLRTGIIMVEVVAP